MKSGIEGSGVFADQDIPKGSIVWKFDPDHDLTLPLEDFERLDLEARADVRKVAYVHQHLISGSIAQLATQTTLRLRTTFPRYSIATFQMNLFS